MGEAPPTRRAARRADAPACQPMGPIEPAGAGSLRRVADSIFSPPPTRRLGAFGRSATGFGDAAVMGAQLRASPTCTGRAGISVMARPPARLVASDAAFLPGAVQQSGDAAGRAAEHFRHLGQSSARIVRGLDGLTFRNRCDPIGRTRGAELAADLQWRGACRAGIRQQTRRWRHPMACPVQGLPNRVGLHTERCCGRPRVANAGENLSNESRPRHSAITAQAVSIATDTDSMRDRRVLKVVMRLLPWA